MLQRGRKSAAAANVLRLSVSGEPARLSPPSYLSKPERSLFVEIVGACDLRHFVESDLPLLCSYIQATLVARAGPGEDLKAWESAVKFQCMLSTRLRLAPQSRSDPVKVARQARDHTDHQSRKPWENR